MITDTNEKYDVSDKHNSNPWHNALVWEESFKKRAFIERKKTNPVNPVTPLHRDTLLLIIVL